MRTWKAVLVPLLIALAAWCLPRSSSAAVTADTANITSATAVSAASLTWSHTVGSGASRILIVGISLRGNETITSVTYGGTTLNLIGSVSNAGQTTSALWSLLAPPEGTANVVVTLSGAQSVRVVGGATTFFGVDPVTPLGTYASWIGSGRTASVTVASATGELVIDTVVVHENDAITVGAGQAQLWNRSTAAMSLNVSGGGSTEAGAASVDMTWALGVNPRIFAIGAVPLRPVPLTGRVFEDVNYGGGAGRGQVAASGVPRSGALVELYDGAGSFVSSMTTDASGDYVFRGIAAGNYTVRVVNSTVSSSRAGYVAGVLPVQTYRSYWSTGTGTVEVTDNVGGQNPAVADAAAGSAGAVMNTTTGVFTAPPALAGGTAQSITNLAVGAAGVSAVDFGFNFDTVVNVNDSGQGSLRQYILNSNALGNAGLTIAGQPAGRDVSIFMISDGLAHPGLRAGIANLLTGGVAVIAPATALEAIIAADTSVDGTTQTTNVGNTNAVVLGTGGTAGVDGLALSQVAGPEVEIAGAGMNASGLLIQADRAVVRGLAIHGFGGASDQAGVRVDAASGPGQGALIENNVLGARATSFTDPGAGQRNQGGVYSGGGSNGTVRNNLIGFCRVTGVRLATGATGWTFAGNEIRDSGMETTNGDGFDINASPSNAFTGNLVTGTSSQGIVLTAAAASGNTFTDNTVTGNGVGIASGFVQSAGITIRTGVTSVVLDRNMISANYGGGVQVNNGATGTRMRRNSFALNGTITARNLNGATGQIGIDLNSSSDNVDLGTWPFYTLNDPGDGDSGGNDLLNFPVLTSATLAGGSLTVRGFARPSSVIELFVAAPDPFGFGEGMTYAITLTEGGAGTGGAGSDDPSPDIDTGIGTYGPGPINGIVQGTDTTNRFAFTVPVPGGVGVGTPLTATATLGGETSEFSGLVTVASATAVTLMSFEATPSDEAVDLSWRTGSELGNLGFHLYRGSSAGGPWTRLTSSLIPGLGSSPVGQSYSWRNAGLVNGQRYYYRLEDVDTTSVSTFHGPVSAVPEAATEAPPPPGRGGGCEGGGGPVSSCPAWVLASYLPDDPAADAPTCTRHGDPEGVSFEVVSRDSSSATVELRTGGFWALHAPAAGTSRTSNAVRVFVPGFELPTDATALALPLRRALVDAIVGKEVSLVSAEATDLRSFRGLAPMAVGAAVLAAGADGTVRPARRALVARVLPRGLSPAEVARLSGTVFQGERKSAVVEMKPVRFDASRGELVLARRVRVTLAFTGVVEGERGIGSRGRTRPRRRAAGDVLARVHTTSRGLYAVSYESLFPGSSWGLSTSSLRLQRQGKAVPFHMEPMGAVFGPGSVLYFYAERTVGSTEYAGEVAYELARSPGVWMGVAQRPVSGAVEVSSTGEAGFETNRIYQAGLLRAPDVWLWEALVSRAPAKTEVFALSGVDAASSEASRLVVFLQGGSESGVAAEHHVRASVRAGSPGAAWTPVGEATFAGTGAYRLEASVPAGVLRDGSNELSLENVGDAGVYSLVFLGRFEVRYPQVPAARGEVLEGVWTGGGTAEVVGLGASPVVLDVTGAETTDDAASEAGGSPRGGFLLNDVARSSAVTWVSGFETAPGAVRFGAEAGHRYVVASSRGLLSPRVERVAPPSLRDATNQADYLVIAPREFLAAAAPLVERRSGEGLASRAVSFEQIVSEFGYGQPSAQAIKEFVSYAYHSWQRPSPRYVLLLGDATDDPQHFRATSWASPLPALWEKTSYLWTASDPSLAAVNGDDSLPDLAIGRLPATTSEQAEALVAKILAWEDSGQGLGGKAVLVADTPDQAGDFEADVDDVRESFLLDRDTATLKVRELGSEARPAIRGAFDEGASLMSYVGHGGSAAWSSSNVLTSWDADALLAQSRQPLLLTLNCLNGYFVAPNFDSLPEALLKAEGRGAIAAVSPSGLSLDGPAHQYHRALMAELTSGRHERLGDAILAAQTAYAETGLMPELLTVYHLLGDPALEIR